MSGHSLNRGDGGEGRETKNMVAEETVQQMKGSGDWRHADDMQMAVERFQLVCSALTSLRHAREIRQLACTVPGLTSDIMPKQHSGFT